jgi:hypothetical protein
MTVKDWFDDQIADIAFVILVILLVISEAWCMIRRKEPMEWP